MTKFFQFIRKVADLYNVKKLLMCGAQFARTHNTAGIDADTQAALRMKSKIFQVNCPKFALNTGLDVAPHSISENAAFEGTPFTSFTASPLRGVPQFKRSLTLSATNDKILSVYKKSSGFIQRQKTANVRSAICAHA